MTSRPEQHADLARVTTDVFGRLLDGTTVIAVLHDLALAAHFFPRVVVIDRARIVADGGPLESLTAERIREVFGVDPALVRLATP